MLERRGAYHIVDTDKPGIFSLQETESSSEASPKSPLKKSKGKTGKGNSWRHKSLFGRSKKKRDSTKLKVEDVLLDEDIPREPRRNSLPHEKDPLEQTKFHHTLSSSDSGASVKRDLRRSTSVVNNKKLLLARGRTNTDL